MNSLIQRILILALATLMFATGWKLSSIKPVLQNKDCVTVLINMNSEKLVDVLNESHTPITYEIQQGMTGQYRNWTIFISETNHTRMPETNDAGEKERTRWSNYFVWMDYTNTSNKTNE